MRDRAARAMPARPRMSHPDAPMLQRLLAADLRERAWDLVGRPDRDELSSADLERVQAEVEEAVTAVLPALGAGLETALVVRLESLPLGIRLTLANVRRRRELGVD